MSYAQIYLFVRKGMRGGAFYVSKRYSKSNNKYLKSHDPKQESKHIIYFGTNNPYNYAMSKFLIAIGFKCMDLKYFVSNKYSSNI